MKLLAIVGCHRSGTSATAGALAHLGADFGHNLMPPSPANPRGYFESMRVVRTHDRLLRAYGSSWDDPRPLEDGWDHMFPAGVARNALVRWLAELKQATHSSVLGVKDPRMARLFPLWREVADIVGVQLVPVLVWRAPGSIVRSLCAREDWNTERALTLVESYTAGLREWAAHRPLAHVEFSHLLDNWRQALTPVDAVAELPLAESLEAHDAVDTFLSRSLNHG